MTEDLHAQLDEAITTHGVQTVQRALEYAFLFRGLRIRSADSLRVAKEWWDKGQPVRLHFTLDPRHKKIGEKVEVTTSVGSLD